MAVQVVTVVDVEAPTDNSMSLNGINKSKTFAYVAARIDPFPSSVVDVILLLFVSRKWRSILVGKFIYFREP